MCTELLPPGGNPIAVKYIISYNISILAGFVVEEVALWQVLLREHRLYHVNIIPPFLLHTRSWLGCLRRCLRLATDSVFQWDTSHSLMSFIRCVYNDHNTPIHFGRTQVCFFIVAPCMVLELLLYCCSVHIVTIISHIPNHIATDIRFITRRAPYHSTVLYILLYR